MSDLISRADAIEAVRKLRDTDGDVWGEALDTLAALPSADAVSDAYKRGFDDCKRAYEIELARSADAVQGEWTHDGSMWENRWVCDKCGHKIFERQTNFCPNCGAVMKGGDAE